MSISAGLDWKGDLGPGADSAAGSVERLAAALRALQGVQGGAKAPAAGGGIGALGAAANRAAVINEKSAADIAKVEAKARAGQALIYAKGDADRAAALNDVVKGQSKASNDAYVAQVKGAEAARRAAEQAALVEQKGASQAANVRAKSAADLAKVEAKAAADRAKIEAKSAADIARDTHKASLKAAASAKTMRVSEETTSGMGGAARAILEGKGLKGALGAFGGKGAKIAAIANVAANVGRAAFNAAKEVAGVGLQFGQAVVAAQAFREDVSEAFKTVTGSADAGDAVMKRALATADKLGTARADTVGQFLDLTTKGFDVAQVERIVASLNDLTTIDPKASMEGLTKVIGKVQATGRLNQETLNELSTFGLEQSDVIKEIGKILKKDDAAVLKALSTAGGIRGLGVEPILAAINKQVGGGPAGEKATEKANRNLSSLIKRVGEVPQNILFDLDVGPGLDGIKGILKSVLDYFAAGSATAERATKAFGDAFNALVSGLLGTDITEEAFDVESLFNVVVMAVEDSLPAIRAFGAALRVTAQFASAVAMGLGLIVGFFAGDDSADVSSGASDMGTSIIDGFVNGITAGAQRVIDAVKGVASDALASAKSVLGIASPSKEFARVGAWSAEGMAIGFDREAASVASSARLMAQDAQLAASLQMPLLSGGAAAMGAAGGGARTIIVQLPPGPLVTVQAAAGVDVAALADELDPHVRRIMIAVWRQIAAEGGTN